MSTLRDLRVVRYIVTEREAEVVSDQTMRRHRTLTIDDAGDITVRLPDSGRIIAAMSAAELNLIVRAHRREMWRRATERVVARLRR